MKRNVLTLAVLLLLVPGLANAADKTAPDFLRNKHAGKATFYSDASVGKVFADILLASQNCYVGKTDPSMSGMGGAAYSLTQAQRIVVSELEPAGESGYVAVRAISGMSLLKANFIQFDVSNFNGGTKVDVYYGRNVEFQKASIDNMKFWLEGDLEACKLDRIQQAARQRAKRASDE